MKPTAIRPIRRRAPMPMVLAMLLALDAHAPARAQQACVARMEQDPSRDNLVHAPDYATAPPATLGGVLREGSGPIPMVLIAGAGFDGEVFRSFMKANGERYRMLAVTLPGFGGTAGPPMPPAGTSYGERTWSRAASAAVARLIEQEGLERPVVVGHWLTGAQVAIDLALDRPDLTRAAVAVSGVPKFMPASGSGMAELTSARARARMVDTYLAPRWFKTVTPETWHDNNFLPRDYAIHPLRALQLWRSAAAPALPVWIRYLCEAWADDGTRRLGQLEVPLLIVKPRFDAQYAQGPQTGDYMEAMLHRAWEGVEQRSDRITVETIEGSRVFVMEDKPDELNDALVSFLAGPGARPRRPAPPAPAEAPAPPERNYWGGRLERVRGRALLPDAGIAFEMPAATWRLEMAENDPPIVARLAAGDSETRVTIQVQPVFGMSLEAMAPLVEQRIASGSAEYRRISLAPTRLAGRVAYRLDATWEREGATTRSVLVFALLDDGHMLSVALRTPPGRFEEVRGGFERLAASVTQSR